MGRDELRIASHAKLNYTLDVLSLRPDRFHNLASLMQTISLCDILEIRKLALPGIEFWCDTEEVPNDASNLVYRAAEMALQAAGREDGVSLRLEKRIPSQAGLGGGSSNAAYTMMGLNQLLDLGLRREKLLELGPRLALTCPFF